MFSYTSYESSLTCLKVIQPILDTPIYMKAFQHSINHCFFLLLLFVFPEVGWTILNEIWSQKKSAKGRHARQNIGNTLRIFNFTYNFILVLISFVYLSSKIHIHVFVLKHFYSSSVIQRSQHHHYVKLERYMTYKNSTFLMDTVIGAKQLAELQLVS